MKPVKAWCVKSIKGNLNIETISGTKDDCIGIFINNNYHNDFSVEKAWEYESGRNGYKIVQVEVTEIKEGDDE